MENDEFVEWAKSLPALEPRTTELDDYKWRKFVRGMEIRKEWHGR